MRYHALSGSNQEVWLNRLSVSDEQPMVITSNISVIIVESQGIQRRHAGNYMADRARESSFCSSLDLSSMKKGAVSLANKRSWGKTCRSSKGSD
uniref:Putative ovule protein n=1 Tax=Solanum chacoense TaxID=4108 RepID=A0A0V0IWE6_SOLCH